MTELCLNPRQGFGSTPKLRECPLPLISFAWHFYSIVNIVSEFLARCSSPLKFRNDLVITKATREKRRDKFLIEKSFPA